GEDDPLLQRPQRRQRPREPARGLRGASGPLPRPTCFLPVPTLPTGRLSGVLIALSIPRPVLAASFSVFSPVAILARAVLLFSLPVSLALRVPVLAASG